MKKSNKMISVFTNLLLGLGSGALVHLFTNDSAASGLATGLGVTLGKDAIDKIASSFSSHGINNATEHLFEYLCSSEIDPSPNLRELFLISFDKAMDALQTEYLDIGSAKKYNDAEYVKVFFQARKNKHDDLFSSIETTLLPESDLNILLTGNTYQGRKQIFDKLGISELKSDMYERFRSFLEARLIPRMISSFYKELQDPKTENIPAWREFQRLELEAVRYQLSLLSEENIEIKALLEKLTGQNVSLEQIYSSFSLEIEALEAESIATRQNTEILIKALRLDKLRLFSETEAWIRKKYRGANTHSPDLDEFKDGRVCIPQVVKAEVEEQLENGEDALLLGKPASGKTVFGLAIAMQWMLSRQTLSIYYDLANVSEALKYEQLNTARSDIDLVLQGLKGDLKDHRLLVILDNVHNDPDFSLDLLDYAESKRDDGCKINTLCLSRKVDTEISETNNLFTIDSLRRVYLDTNEEAFLCVARRLCVSKGIEPIEYSALASNWITTCGGNLVAFAMAFDPPHPEALDQEAINQIIIDKYLSEAEKQGNLDKFLELCVLNSLDIDLNLVAIWSLYSLASIFPSFERNRILEIVIRNNQTYCHLFHPSLASLCIKVRRSTHPGTDQISILKDLCKKDVNTFVVVLTRLNTNQYWKKSMILEFAGSLRNSPGMLIEAFLRFPAQFHKLTGFADRMNWSSIELDETQFSILCKSLARANLTLLEPFFKAIENTGLALRSNEILEKLLQDDAFKLKLKQAQLQGIAGFMSFVETTGQRFRARPLMEEVLTSPVFQANIRSALAPLIIEFCNYLGTTVYHKQAHELLGKLLANPDFYQSLIKHPAHSLVHVFKLLSRSSRREEVPKLIKTICTDKDYRDRLAVSNGFGTLPLLIYLSHIEPNIERELLRYLMDSDIYRHSICRSPLKSTVAFMEYIRNKGYDREVKQLCVSIVTRKGFSTELLSDNIGAIDKFFRLLINLGLYEEYLQVFQPLLGSPALIEKLTGQVFGIAYPLVEMISKIGKKEQLKSILQALTCSREFCESLFAHECTSAMIPLVRLLADSLNTDRQKYVDNIFNLADWQMVIDHAAHMKPKVASYMLAAIKNTDICFPDMYENQLRTNAGDLFQEDITPHPDYPNNLLMTWDVQTLINKLDPLIRNMKKYQASRIVASLMENNDKFMEWLGHQTKNGRLQLQLYSEKKNLIQLRKHFTPLWVTAREARELAKQQLLREQHT